MPYRPRALSYSQLELYSRCPAAWARRYIHGVVDRSPAASFGICFARALEALHQGQDGEVAFVRSYAASQSAGELPIGSPSIQMGLRLLALYQARGVFQGQPEYRWSLYLPNRDAVPVPLVGVFDLLADWGVMEAKTGTTKWDQGRCDSSLQGQLYNWAYTRTMGRKPQRVHWLCFHTGRGELQEFESFPASGELYLIELQAAATWRGIRDGKFPALCGKPWCQACIEAGNVATKAPYSGLMLEL